MTSTILNLQNIFQPAVDDLTVAALLGKNVVGLNESLPVHVKNPKLAPVSRNTPEGTRVYKRSISFLLGCACQLARVGHVSIMETIASSLHFSLSDEVALNDDTVKLLMDAMTSLITSKVTIECEHVARSDLLKYFESIGAKYSLALVNGISDEYIACHTAALESGKYIALAQEVLVPNSSFINPAHFRIEVQTAPMVHFRLHFAVCNIKTGNFEFAPSEELKMTQAYLTRKNWSKKIQFESVSQLNNAVSNSKVKSIIQLSEALHDNQIVSIASRIAGNPGEVMESPPPRLVLIAGPSSSGKTTFAKRLSVALETLGALPLVISVDGYYKSWKDIDERGMQYVDWESLNSLNLTLLNENLVDLLNNKEVLIPEYNMTTSEPMPKEHWTKVKLPEGGMIIIEGIHGLNPDLTPLVPKKEKFQIMISPLSGLIVDDAHLISSTQVRMLRRMVRDYLFRGRSAFSTLRQWPGVALGERKYIYPNQNNADVVMNSALAYEAHSLKIYAEPLLKTITPDMDEYSEARRLLKMLEYLVAIPTDMVPPQSLLREFVGGSWFYDYAGNYKNA